MALENLILKRAIYTHSRSMFSKGMHNAHTFVRSFVHLFSLTEKTLSAAEHA